MVLESIEGGLTIKSLVVPEHAQSETIPDPTELLSGEWWEDYEKRVREQEYTIGRSHWIQAWNTFHLRRGEMVYPMGGPEKAWITGKSNWQQAHGRDFRAYAHNLAMLSLLFPQRVQELGVYGDDKTKMVDVAKRAKKNKKVFELLDQAVDLKIIDPKLWVRVSDAVNTSWPDIEEELHRLQSEGKWAEFLSLGARTKLFFSDKLESFMDNQTRQNVYEYAKGSVQRYKDSPQMVDIVLGNVFWSAVLLSKSCSIDQQGVHFVARTQEVASFTASTPQPVEREF